MSYCRFSSDDYLCDVYVYESCMGGFTIHVASTKIVYKKELPPSVSIDNMDKWLLRHEIVMKMLKDAEYVKIGLPCDGKTFNETTAIHAAKRLIKLKDIGYRVPQYAIDSLMEE